METWALDQHPFWLVKLAFWLATTPHDDASALCVANSNVAQSRQVPVLNWPTNLFADEVSGDAEFDPWFGAPRLTH